MEQLRLRGMSSVLWSVDTRDWADRNSQIVCSRAVASAHPGAIILMHDIHQTSVEAVPLHIIGAQAARVFVRDGTDDARNNDARGWLSVES